MEIRRFGGKDYNLAMVDGPNTKHSSKEVSDVLGEQVFVRNTQGKSNGHRVTNIWVRDKPKRKQLTKRKVATKRRKK